MEVLQKDRGGPKDPKAPSSEASPTAVGWPTDDGIASGASKFCLRLSPSAENLAQTKTRTEELRDAYRALARGQHIELEVADLLGLQVLALDVVQKHFQNTYGSDAALKHEVGEKQRHMAQFRLPEEEAQAILGGARVDKLQRDALRVLLETFHAKSSGDEALRRAVFDKLAALGNERDFDAVMRYARAGTASDLWHANQAAINLAQRVGPPIARGPGAFEERVRLENLSGRDPSGRLPAHPALIEAMLESDPIERRESFSVGNYNVTERVTFPRSFKMSDGHKRRARAVYKPEPFWENKSRAYFSREAAAYQLDRQFLRTNMVPPTVEAFLPRHGRMEIGSLQYWVEETSMLGRDAVTWSPELEHLKKKPSFQRQLDDARVFIFIANDPDKLPNNVFNRPNYRNLLVGPGENLFLIDNAPAFGGLWGEVSKDILPNDPNPRLVGRIKNTDPEAVKEMLAPRVGAGQAGNVARRMKLAADELRTRLPRSAA